MNKPRGKNSHGLFKTLGSIKFGITLLVAIALVAVVGTLIPQGKQSEFYLTHYGSVLYNLITILNVDNTYHSPLFIGLLGLLGINLFLCFFPKIPSRLRYTFKPERELTVEAMNSLPVTAVVNNVSLLEVAGAFSEHGFKLSRVDDSRLYGERGRMGNLGSSLVHLSLLSLLSGGLVSMITGERGYIVLEDGQSVSEAAMFGGRGVIPLGFKVMLNRFEVEFYDEYPGRPKSYTSYVAVMDSNNRVFEKAVRVNQPLMHGGFTISQSSYGVSEGSMPVSQNGDTAVVEVRLKGMHEDSAPLAVLSMVQGETYKLEGFGDSVTVVLSELHRNYERIVSISNEQNPAVKLDISIKGVNKWSIYAFQNFPGLNMPMNNDCDFQFYLKDIKQVEQDKGRTAYYTVLGVVRDRGIPIMWFGAVIMIAGLFCSFYIIPRRVWVYRNDSSVIIGAVKKGDIEPLRDMIKIVVARLKHSGDKKGKSE